MDQPGICQAATRPSRKVCNKAINLYDVLNCSFRVQPGQCYRLYTRWHYDKMSEYQLPEILRKPLEELVLQVKVQYPCTCVYIYQELMSSGFYIQV